MDYTEAIVERYLAHLRLGTPVYEPDGNVPPDFLLAGHIAVEVRRLNQNDHRVDRPRGLEEDQIPLLTRMQKLLASFGPPRDGRSWFVSYKLTRPLPSWKTLKSELTRVLEKFATQSSRCTESAELGSPLCLKVYPASTQHPEMFILGGYSDRDAGGWLLAEMERNLQICIREKTRKIQPFRSKYPRWWLVFVDHIGYALNDYDRSVFSERVRVHHDWDRIVLIDPLDYTRAFDLPHSSGPS